MVCVVLGETLNPSSAGPKASRLSDIYESFPVPKGFVILADAYLEHVKELPINNRLKDLKPDDIEDLVKVSGDIKTLITNKPLSAEVLDSVKSFASKLNEKIVVRSSSIQEDLKDLTFAGQYDSFLDLENRLEVLETYIKLCWSSLFTPRAMSYRHHNNLKQENLSIAVLVQNMIYGTSGVVFSVNPNTGEDEVLIEFHAKGVVSGEHNAHSVSLKSTRDAYDYFSLKADDQQMLFNYTKDLSQVFQSPLDIEWVIDSKGLLSVLQVRPLQVLKQEDSAPFISDLPILIGSAVGRGVFTGVVHKIKDPKEPFKAGSVLVVSTTSPEWEPVMRKAKALITDFGSKTSHASLVAREMNLPAIVGTGDACLNLKDGQHITLELNSEIGLVYGGLKC